MRKILILLLISSQVHSQTPQSYASLEVVGSKITPSDSPTNKGYYYINPFYSRTFANSNFGFFVEGWIDSDVYGLSPGLFFKNENAQNLYFETGVGYGLEIAKSNTKDLLGYINGYLYFENKSDDFTSKNKLVLNTNYAYYPSDQSLWYLGSAIYFPIRNIGAGIHVSSFMTGPRVQLNIDGQKLKKSLWFAVGQRSFALGVQIVCD